MKNRGSKAGFPKFYIPNNKAFTLIELLVVIAIIGIISSVVLASISSARARAQDAAKNEEARQIINALEMYYQKYGGYPVFLSNPIRLMCLGFKPNESCFMEIINDNINNAIKEFMPGLKANKSPAPGNLMGILYRCRNNNLINDKCPKYEIIWYLASPDGRCLGNAIQQESLPNTTISSCTYSK